ncbi:hypothetical protein [Reyranella sp.]|uniref:hypothetical protein n=1 Tax=Reyranella sp. TaxID=1929291 RepID=UPI001218A07B|nr:hypothetical protein [Reyranella sp.]TAJ89697.1 MAG: hypothetical protein EPO50_04860 [Reyranella sp.]
MSRHKMQAFVPFGLGDLEVEIAFDFTRGRPAAMYLRNGDPGYPADPDEVEFVSARLVDREADPVMQKMAGEWAEEYLAGDAGRALALEAAADADDLTREYAAELRRDA